VGITEGFMEALVNDKDWELVFPDTEHPKYKTEWQGNIEEWKQKDLPVVVHEKCKAKEIWDLIMQSTYNRNEPGVLFLDVANKLNPAWWFDLIETTNPCFSGDTLIATADGRNTVTIKQLANEGKDVPVYSLNPKTGMVEIKTGRNPRITGRGKKLVRITLDDGSSFDVTPDHKCLLKTEDGYREILAKDLKRGDSLPRFSKRQELPVKTKILNNVLGEDQVALSVVCANELGFDVDVKNVRLLKIQQEMIQQGYVSRIVENGVFVEKTCEGCSKIFEVGHTRREISFCNDSCYKQNGMKKYYSEQANKIKERQACVWSELNFKLGRKPLKKEWSSVCKERGVSPIIPSDTDSFKTYKEVEQAGLEYNHKVLSVEELPGQHAVYNITIDDNHTVSIITDIKYDKKGKPLSYNGVNVLNCGEVCMSVGVCDLGSINLTQFVKIDGETVEFDYEKFGHAIKYGIRFLDNICDISTTPLPEYDKSVQDKRRIGLGVMGLGSLHIMMGIKYGSEQSKKFVSELYRFKCEKELLTSANLGKEKGSFLKFDKQKYFSSNWWKTINISPSVKKEIEEMGCMRNSHHSMNAPTGNTGIYARNVSGGIEPVFNTGGYYRWSIVPEFQRRELIEKGFKFPDVVKHEWFETEHMKFAKRGDEDILKGLFQGKNYEFDKNRGLTEETYIEDYGVKFAKKTYSNFEEMKKNGLFPSAQELTVNEHLTVLKEAAHYTNMSISKTVNVPQEYPYDDFKNLYLDAWKNNLKGITTYRAGTMTAVLEVKDEKKKEDSNTSKIVFTENHAPKRPKELSCDIYHMTVKGEKWTIFVGLLEDKPYEIFAGRSKFVHLPKSRKNGTIKKNGVYNLYTGEAENQIVIEDLATVFENSTESAFTRTLSLALRHGVPTQYVVEQLEKGTNKDSDMFSLGKALQRVLKNYIKNGTKVTSTKTCPACESTQIIYQDGCAQCLDCFYTKCS
jgi:ribonucleotide reductase alpha subunit